MGLKVLLGHNRYQWWGGEDMAHRLDQELLERHGHPVVDYVRDNAEIDGLGPVGRARTAATAIWSPRSRREVATLVARERPDVAYFVNTFPLISPAALASCRDAGVPVVLGMHTYRTACPNAFLFRDGDVCEDCLARRVKWPGVLHACYRDSRVQTAAVATMLAAHDLARTWVRVVDVFMAVSEFGRTKLIEAGLPAERVEVRPNFTYPDPAARGPAPDGGYALAIGRLSAEKGVGVLLEAFARLPDVPLRVVGDGPERPAMEERIRREGLGHVDIVGQVDHDEVLTLLRGATALVFPALSYEHCPFAIVEAFACSTPVIASDRGAMTEMVGGNDAGLLFRPNDPRSLEAAVRSAWSDPAGRARWSENARAAFERTYSADGAYRRLLEVFAAAGARRT